MSSPNKMPRGARVIARWKKSGYQFSGDKGLRIIGLWKIEDAAPDRFELTTKEAYELRAYVEVLFPAENVPKEKRPAGRPRKTIPDPPKVPKPMGRPRKYADNAAKQRAYRQRTALRK